MTEILTVTLNPALDLASSAPRVFPGEKLRCGPETAEPGGGGVNVARAILNLGGKARAVVALGGVTGAALQELIAEQGLETFVLKAPGETRRSFSVIDESNGEQYRFVMTGPAWKLPQIDEMLATLDAEAGPDAFVVLSGSMPPGANPGFIPRACARLPGRKVVVDTSGAHLEAQALGTDPKPFVLRMNGEEAEELAGQPLDSQKDSANFAEKLRQRGAADIVIMARGPDGSVMADGQGLWHVTAPNSTVVSAIGAGDSFVGAFVMSLAEGRTTTEALRRGSASASSAVESPGSQLCRRADFDRLLPQTVLKQV